ncbi:MAG: alpha/beta fold hydrolase, partial [Candidatus Eremiobacterota bacterium]
MQDVRVPATDGYPLAASVYPPPGERSGLVVINSAAAVPRRFYRHFAEALTQAGYLVVTYDYRGIGESRPPSMKGFEARMRDWAEKDMAAVIDWALAEHGPGPLILVGHSFGGQVPGLLPQGERVAAMLTFSSQSG